ncbi:hypothetical protein VKT23_002690 [Stygiomarasmius scandens]|uniref:F-box domain-containing protein n=1 Tax=Marasmiellus scandens TaxID=2682957 RepID=A0ABR1K3V8_9AGAR
MFFVPRVSLDLDETWRQVRSGEVPSAEQCSLISEFLAGAEQDLQEYNAEALRLQAFIDAVTAKANQLERLMQMKQSLLAPVRKLPDELLALIFERCSFDLFEEKEPAVVYVCSRWRNIALSTPALWSHLVLKPHAGRKYYGPRAQRALDLHLERSKFCPLTIEVSLRSQDIFHYSGPHSKLYSGPFQLLNVLARYSHRWKRFELVLDPDLKNEQRKLLTDYFSAIHDLSLLKSFAYKSALLPDVRTISTIFKLAVNLESLCLPCLPPDAETFFPGTNITCLELSVCYSAEVFKLVGKCPRLQSLTYILDSCDGRVLPGLVPQKSATVQSLEIILARRSKEVFPAIIDSLDFPSLDSLKVSLSTQVLPIMKTGYYREQAWPSEHFNEFLLRSGCKLKSFSLSEIHISDIELCQLLQSDAFSHLGNLAISSLYEGVDSPISTAFLKRLSSDALIPRLTKLSLVAKVSLFDDEAFAEAVLSRCPARVPADKPGYLRSVFLLMKGRVFDPLVYRRLRDGAGSLDLQIVDASR